MGTAAFMSPEQAAGKVVDRRADIWALGVVLWEMLTGQRLFTGESVSHVLAAVRKTEPDWSLLPPDTPALLRRLLRRCLEKDRKRRLQHIGDARADIEDARAAPGRETMVYALGGALLAVPFDVDRLDVTGGPVPVVEGVSRAGLTGAANGDIARTGALVYLPRGAGAAVRTLVWVDWEGTDEAAPTTSPPTASGS